MCTTCGYSRGGVAGSVLPPTGVAGSIGGGIPGGPITSDPNVQQTLNIIASDPDGQRILAAAQQRGVTISVANIADPEVEGFYQRSTNAITVRDPNNIKTIAHELVHAGTTEDGNSQREEGLAEVIATRIDARVRGQGIPNAQAVFNEKIQNYPTLNPFNQIDQSLSALGIMA